ncbi:DUF4861 domain-containing protein [Novosphingobium sp. 1949]|uniref:DUF4861 domain-containing protein n=1 Tax=Novosphingobium organovorum TaxID=2930092 RepID=A0ABT0BD27_9SPHN|nr:DUF4861 family protein [Novosphingobium organovorum]MCJ2182874.1 DUF4861 domain-containing protein [Novosphingobium organovorum]
MIMRNQRRASRAGVVLALVVVGITAVGAAPAPRQVAAGPSAQAGDQDTPRAVAQVAAYRYDDLLWENDRTAHRIYARPLEAAEPPSGSGIDSWGKNVARPFADRQLRTGDQHRTHGEGLDFYNVGTSRGAGGLGIWYDNKLWTSRNYVRSRILQTGGQVADFEVDYAPWPVDVARRVWETRRFTLPLGTHFTRMVSTLRSDSSAPLVVGIGIGKHTTGGGHGELTIDRERGMISWWGPQDGDHGRMAIAIRVDPKQLAQIREDASNYLILLNVTPGMPFVYYSASAWSEGQDHFTTRSAWDAYVRGEPLDFHPPKEGA